MGASADTAISGFGFLPGIFDMIGYPSREDAKAAGIERIQDFFQSELASKNSCSSDSNQKNIAECLRLIEAEKSQPKLDLFSPVSAQTSQGGEYAQAR